MLTIIESPLFSKLWSDYWTEEERAEFVSFLSACPDAGDIIPKTGGCRKVRWSRAGMGKSGGVRVIYTVKLANEAIVLLVIYSKNVTENISPHLLKKIAEELGHATY